MKKNKFMRIAAVLVVLALLSTCAISGTFAKYTSTMSSEDTARVAYWGFRNTSMDITELFSDSYKNTPVADAGTGTDVTVLSKNNGDVIAPGTTNSATFTFNYDAYNTNITAPEVDYTFTVSTEGSSCGDDIKNNPNILWKLDSGNFGTWDTLLTDIQALAGSTDNAAVSGVATYQANTLPENFDDNDVHTVTWKWIFDENATNVENDTANNDVDDTTMGNRTEAETLDTVTLKITVTATQID